MRAEARLGPTMEWGPNRAVDRLRMEGSGRRIQKGMYGGEDGAVGRIQIWIWDPGSRSARQRCCG